MAQFRRRGSRLDEAPLNDLNSTFAKSYRERSAGKAGLSSSGLRFAVFGVCSSCLDFAYRLLSRTLRQMERLVKDDFDADIRYHNAVLGSGLMLDLLDL